MRHGVYLQISTEQVLIFKNLLFLPQTNSESKDAGLGIRDLVFGFSCTAHCSAECLRAILSPPKQCSEQAGCPTSKAVLLFCVYAMEWTGMHIPRCMCGVQRTTL